MHTEVYLIVERLRSSVVMQIVSTFCCFFFALQLFSSMLTKPDSLDYATGENYAHDLNMGTGVEECHS